MWKKVTFTEKKFYTYTLAYPVEMGGYVFYVGKGTSDRMLEHEIEANNDGRGRKCVVIRGIWAKGYQIEKYIVFESDIEQDVLLYEWAGINMLYASHWLTNIAMNTYDCTLSPFEEELREQRNRDAFLLAQSRGFKKERKPVYLTDPCADEFDDLYLD